jgi:hypothetical protein
MRAGLLVRVAGPGFEPGPSGYEPDEIPLLYPAMPQIYEAISILLINLKSRELFSDSERFLEFFSLHE